jgi:hypothetical protein
MGGCCLSWYPLLGAKKFSLVYLNRRNKHQKLDMAGAELHKMAVPVPFVCLQVQDLQNELREEKQISRRFATEEACSTLSC